MKEFRGREGEAVHQRCPPGIEDAVREIFPGAKWELCVVHAMRDSLSEVSKADREALAQDLEAICRADTYRHV